MPESGWTGTLMTDGTAPSDDANTSSKNKREMRFKADVPEGERAAVESFIAEHGVALLLDVAAQICDDTAHRKGTEPLAFHIQSMLSITLDSQISRSKAIEELEEG